MQWQAAVQRAADTRWQPAARRGAGRSHFQANTISSAAAALQHGSGHNTLKHCLHSTAQHSTAQHSTAAATHPAGRPLRHRSLQTPRSCLEKTRRRRAAQRTAALSGSPCRSAAAAPVAKVQCITACGQGASQHVARVHHSMPSSCQQATTCGSAKRADLFRTAMGCVIMRV
jgi:hypothetical protein